MGINAIWGPPKSGKTTLTIDIACAFAQNRKSVCIVSPEPYSEMSARLGIQIKLENSLTAAYRPGASINQVVHRVNELLYVLAVPWDNDAFGQYAGSSAAKQLLEQAAAVFDFVLVDCPSHADTALSAWAMNMADNVLLLSGFDPSAGMWYTAFQRGIAPLEARTVPICVAVTKDYDYLSLCELIRQTPIVWVPHFPNAAEVQAQKKTLYGDTGKAGHRYSDSIDKICVELEADWE